MTQGEKAKALFLKGYNCSQSVAMAFAQETGLDEKTIARITKGFGGGVGRMREVCGAVNAMAFVISAIYDEDKTEVYRRVQEVAGKFRRKNGSIVCRELLGLKSNEESSPVAEKRTQKYYEKRPCAELVKIAAEILEEYIKAN